jgi:hypothetical protein
MVRWADVAAPWLATIGGDSHGTRFEASVVARVALRYDDEKGDLVHDEEYEAVIFPLTDPVDVTRSIAVDYDDRDLRPEAPAQCVYRLRRRREGQDVLESRRARPDRLPGAFANGRDTGEPRPQAVRSTRRECRRLRGEVPRHRQRSRRQGDSGTAFQVRSESDSACNRRSKPPEIAPRFSNTERKGRQTEEVLSTAGSILGGLLGGKRSRGGMLGSILGKAGSAAGRRSRSAAAGDRLDAAENKLEGLHRQLEDLEAELTQEVTDIDAKWMSTAKNVTTLPSASSAPT